ncbi:hypothetical protein ACFFLM_04500 [Deinococcus oregonensis]|uniref:Portal protein n=1 Tax=Deinococcus oregonensis TaxID=1805970 RepID=A0ABV6AUR0_9DEIO
MTAPALVLPFGVTLPPLARLMNAAKAAQESRTRNATLSLHMQLYNGDLWADGKGWSGPRPDPLRDQSPSNAAYVLSEIQRTFVSRNPAKDIVERHQSGVAGREPLYSVLFRDGRKPGTAEAKRLDEYTRALTDWWEDSGAWPAVQSALRTALVTKAGSIRLYIFGGSLADITDAQGRPARGIPRGLSLSDAARRVSIHAPRWDQAGVTRDRDGHVTGAYHTYVNDVGQPRWEVHERVAGGTLVHPDMLSGGTDNVEPTFYPVPDLMLYELQLDPIITDSVRRLILAANKTLTMGSRNIDLGGFVERTILNGQMPGEFKDDPKTPGKKRFVPHPLNVGAGATNYVIGVPLSELDAKGKMVPSGGLTTPSIVYKDPTVYDVFKMSFDQLREAILDEANQLHVLIAGDASASGVSRQQAVNDFLSSLEPTRIVLEQLLKWLLDTVLRLALHFTGRTSEIDAVRVRVQARMSVVQPTPAEIDIAIKLHEAGLISEESAMGRVGIEDVDAERATRQAEGITPALALKILDKAPTWIGVRALQLAFPALGITDEDVQLHRDMELAPPTGPADLALEENPEDGPKTGADGLSATADAATAAD